MHAWHQLLSALLVTFMVGRAIVGGCPMHEFTCQESHDHSSSCGRHWSSPTDCNDRLQHSDHEHHDAPCPSGHRGDCISCQSLMVPAHELERPAISDRVDFDDYSSCLAMGVGAHAFEFLLNNAPVCQRHILYCAWLI
jgi:hypothetical protein